MKRKFRLISAFACAGAMLIWTCPTAYADFIGNVEIGSGRVTVQISAGSDNAGPTRATVYYLGRGFELEAVFLVPTGTTHAQGCPSPTSRVKSIVVEVDPPLGGQRLCELPKAQEFDSKIQSEERNDWCTGSFPRTRATVAALKL